MTMITQTVADHFLAACKAMYFNRQVINFWRNLLSPSSDLTFLPKHIAKSVLEILAYNYQNTPRHTIGDVIVTANPTLRKADFTAPAF